MTDLTPTAGQLQGIALARELAHNFEDEPKVVVVGGYAGTGKTTMLRMIARELEGIVVITPTGKSAQRVIEAAGIPALTLHRWGFKPVTDKETGELSFVRKEPAEISRPESGVVVLEEFSMVDAEVWSLIQDICKEIRCNILCVGDAFQIPPVAPGQEDFSFMSPDFPVYGRILLKEVMRQALDSPIIRASMLVRSGQVSEALKMFPRVSGEDFYPRANEITLGGGVVLCHKNTTRYTLNANIRRLRGLEGTPTSGEPLLVTKNCYEVNRFNGETTQFREWLELSSRPHTLWNFRTKTRVETKIGVARVGEDTRHDLVVMAERDFAGGLDSVGFGVLSQFKRQATKILDHYDLSSIPVLHANFGHTLTCHKAQGSEWDHVLIFLERSLRLQEEAGRRWLYTALTRGKKDVDLFGAIP